jgi:hypothetical protein
MQLTEVLHAQPEAGLSFSPCCGRTLTELPRYDRVTLNPELVTCGRLSPEEALLLSGQPIVADPDHEKVVYSMAVNVCSLSQGLVPLPAALNNVNAAIRELLPSDRTLEAWTAELMVAVTSRAQHLAFS